MSSLYISDDAHDKKRFCIQSNPNRRRCCIYIGLNRKQGIRLHTHISSNEYNDVNISSYIQGYLFSVDYDICIISWSKSTINVRD